MENRIIDLQALQLEHTIDITPSTGRASAAISLPSPVARAGFNPSLSLHYSASAKNSIFGRGWSVEGFPFVSIDTSKGFPKYDSTDQFAFNGVTNLLPQKVRSSASWINRTDENANYRIQYFRAKTEKEFIRFEKWTDKISGKIHWRSRSKNDVLSVYGFNAAGETKIHDPENEYKTFLWLLEVQYDPNGNAILYKYKSENADGINTLNSYETNRLKRFSQSGFSQKYPERIIYGNTKPVLPDTAEPAGTKWTFDLVFDYGEYANRPFTSNQPLSGATWPSRVDSFSVYNAGFEIRTFRKCHRILIYHHFDELNTPTSLGGLIEFDYNSSESGDTLAAVGYTGIRRNLITGSYTEKSLPKLTFKYTRPEVGQTFQAIVQETNENLPQGFNHFKTRIIDLFGEGIPGILTESASTWYYKPNHGNGNFGQQEIVISKPTQDSGIYSLGDFDQDGNINLYTLQGRTAGFYEYDREQERWSGFKPFYDIPQTGPSKFIDIDGDGFPDLVVEHDDRIVCYPFKGKDGFDKPYEFAKHKSGNAAHAPTIGENTALEYFFADMTGDGLPDQVTIRNGQVIYYPNLGNGRFDEAVVMEGAPVFDFDSNFDAARIRLYDLTGSGTSDIIYLGRGEIRYWYNASGNKFIEGGRITGLPYIDNISSAIILDFLGNGTPCLVWSTSLSHLQYASVRYLELTGGIHAGLLTSLQNSMGKEVTIEYGYSGSHYLDARRNGTPWISKLPVHFVVANKKTVIDHVTQSRTTTEYKYCDGYYDGHERSFVTFGLVERYDTELYGNITLAHDADYAQPSCLKLWFHNGLLGWDAKRASQYYGKDPKQQLLTHQNFEQTEALVDVDFLQAYRALAGNTLRQEQYPASAEGKKQDHPYQVTQYAYAIRMLQPSTLHDEAAFYCFQTESVTSNYETRPEDPRIVHHLALQVGEFGDIETELVVAYARRATASGIEPAQTRDLITTRVHRFLHVNTLAKYHTSLLYEGRDFEVNHLAHPADVWIKRADVQSIIVNLVLNALAYHQTLPTGGASQARLLSWDRTYFWDDAFSAALPLGNAGVQVFAHHEETACFNDNTIANAFSGKVTASMLSDANEGNYVQRDGYWWQHSAVNHVRSANEFFVLDRVERLSGGTTTYKYDAYLLNVVETVDMIGNVSKGDIDYNVLEPFRFVDPNDNVSEVLYDPLGVAIATFKYGTVSDETDTVQKYGSGMFQDYTRRNDESVANILANPLLFIQQADYFLFYDFDCWKDQATPLTSLTLVRENLVHDGKGNVATGLKSQMVIEYQDGFGRAIQSKRKVEAGLAVKRLGDGTVELDFAGEPVLTMSTNRWLVSGHIVYNNKQQPVRQFESFFSGIHEFESDDSLETHGVSAHNYYDAMGRAFRTDQPNGTFTEVLFSSWETQAFDQNDTVDRSLYKTFREFLANTEPEKMALDRSLAHKATPTIAKIDPLGREFYRSTLNNDATERKVIHTLDITGDIHEITDARNLKAFEYKRDMLGRLLYEKSMDAGEKWTFHNNFDQVIHLWDTRNVHHRTRYDSADRVVSIRIDGALGLNHVVEKFVYGEDPTLSNAKDRNLRGQLVIHYDQAGKQEVSKFTPEGAPLIKERILLDQFTTEPDWNNPAAVALSAEKYSSSFTYDAAGKLTEQQLPDNIVRKFTYNDRGGITKITVSSPSGNVEILQDTDYDAKGMRQKIHMGNHVVLDYTYDAQTFRLKRLLAHKTNGVHRTYQDIAYTYDPIGNLIYFIDQAQQPSAASHTVVQGLNVSAHNSFEYDALYQLKSASGRAHQALLQNDYVDRSRESGVAASWAKGSRHITLNNGAAVERYTRSYQYDLAGNLVKIGHSGSSQNWTQQYWTSPSSNRSLPLNELDGTPVTNPTTRFDANGNCIYLPHLRSIEWNYRNNISKAVIIDRAAQGKANDEEYYVYGGDGMRVRKITQRVTDVASNTVELTEKIFLDGCEIKRIVAGGTEVLKRFTSHIGDGTNTLAHIHSWEKDQLARETDDIAKRKIHYQLSNHIGSSSLELDENGDVITYEEYFPFGGTSFIAGRSKREIDMKDYRYSGKERDDFTGLYYFGYRYYAHWLGSWMSPDPIGPKDSENLYLYVHNNPVNLVDPNGLETTTRVGAVRAGLSEAEAIREFNSGQGLRLGIRVTDLERRGNDWYIVSARNLTPAELQRIRELQEQWAEHPEIAEMFTELEVTLGELNLGLPTDDSDTGSGTGTDSGTGGGTGTSTGTGTGDSTGTGTSSDPGSGGVNNGTGTTNNVQTNGGGGGGNTGDGTGSGAQGTGSGGGGTGTSTTPGTGATGTGSTSGTGTGTRTGAGTRSGSAGGTGGEQGQGSGSGGEQGGQEGGTPNGVVGGQVGGSPDGVLGGQLGGGQGGDLQGDINGHPDGIPNGTTSGTPTGSESGTGTTSETGAGTTTQDQTGTGTEDRQGTTTGEGGQPGGQGGSEGQQGQQGDPNTNWLDTATRWAGYLNLEFGGSGEPGGAGGIPGGLDLFGWRPPMWVRRTLQVLYIATTIVTTVIPIGKAAIAAKVAVQGALKIGLKTAARQLATAIVAKIPTRAAMAAGAKSIGHLAASVPLLLGALIRRSPRSLIRPTEELLERVAKNPNALRTIANEIHGLGNVFGETVAVTRATLRGGQEVFLAAVNSGARRLNPSQLEVLAKYGINEVPQFFRNIPIMRKIYHAEVNMMHYLGDAPLDGLRWGISMVGNKASHLCGDCLRRIRMFDRQMGISSVIENLL